MSISGLAHVNLIVPEGSLDLAQDFYATTLGLTPRPVPALQRDSLAWFDIGNSGQQVHIAFGPDEIESRRHPCFQLPSAEALYELQTRIWEHYTRGGKSAPRQADEPGKANSGAKGEEYPTRFFARDFAGKHAAPEQLQTCQSAHVRCREPARVQSVRPILHCIETCAAQALGRFQRAGTRLCAHSDQGRLSFLTEGR